MRRKKVNKESERVDFIDEIGDKWQEFPVLHQKFKDWILSEGCRPYLKVKGDNLEQILTDKESLQYYFENSPWYGSTANDIDWIKRVEIQSIIQKYTTHSISSTINLPSTVSLEEVSTIYMESYKKGLKGITVYVDGSRSGVLVTEKPNISTTDFNYVDAVKRPKQLDAEAHITKVGGKPHYVIVGLMNDKPYEVFIETEDVIPQGKGKLTKLGRGRYKFTQNGYERIITASMSDEQTAITRLVSAMLRHRGDIKFIVEQLNKTDGDLFSFTKGVARVLKKYIPDGTKSTVTCQDCGSDDVIFEEGCNKCRSCGSSKCG